MTSSGQSSAPPSSTVTYAPVAPTPIVYSGGQPVQYQGPPPTYAQPQAYEQHASQPQYGQPQPVYYAQQPVAVAAQPVSYYPVQPMSVAAPTVVVQAVQVAGITPFQTELCDFQEDCGTCVLACLFPCAVVGQNEELLTGPNGPGCFCSCMTACAVAGISSFLAILPIVWPCYLASNRSNVRQRLGVDGDFCSDCLTHFFCSPCALTQESLEIRKRTGQLMGPPQQAMN